MACSQVAKEEEDGLPVWRIVMAATMLDMPFDKPLYTHSSLEDRIVAKNPSTH
jgi:hypothetical protein